MTEAFRYERGTLHCEDLAAPAIAEQTGTPCYVYSRASFLGRFRTIRDAFGPLDALIAYAVKANSNLNLLRLLADEGSGFDVVSGGELARVLDAGGDPKKTTFAGVGKTDDEIRQALTAGIRHLNVESPGELERIDRIARDRGEKARVALRVNPDVDPQTHRYITTGKAENKFGIDLQAAAELARGSGDLAGIELVGLHAHIGSQVGDPAHYVASLQKLLALRDELAGYGVAIRSLNLGGGYKISYEGSEGRPAGDYAAAIAPLLEGKGIELEIEPGRWIAGPSGVLLTRVVEVKRGGEKRFVIVDAAMNDLVRPSLYGSYHAVWPVSAEAGPPDLDGPGNKTESVAVQLSSADVVGPICETGDFLAQDRPFPDVDRGDLVAVFCAGAYGFTMASNYNSRGRPPEVLVDRDGFTVIRRRESYEDLVALERA